MSRISAELLAHVEPEAVRWVWEPYLPRGKVSVLDGDPGVGKSLLTLDLAARLSRGGPLPDGTPAGGPHTVLLLNAEDGAADTIRPRAEAAGADLSRLVAVRGPGGDPLAFPADLPALVTLVRRHRPALIVIDPIMAFLPPGVAANSDQSVRRVLGRLKGVAEREGCAILLVRHLRKLGAARAMYRGLGSIGFAAAARATLLAARHPDDPGLGVLTGDKSNLARPAPALGFRVAADPRGRAVVTWCGPADVSADALAQLPPPPLAARDRAETWLREQLAGGPRPAAAVGAAATAANIPERTLNRAKADLGARSHRVERKGRAEWYWYDPDAPWPADAPFKKPYELPRLPEL